MKKEFIGLIVVLTLIYLFGGVVKYTNVTGFVVNNPYNACTGDPIICGYDANGIEIYSVQDPNNNCEYTACVGAVEELPLPASEEPQTEKVNIIDSRLGPGATSLNIPEGLSGSERTKAIEKAIEKAIAEKAPEPKKPIASKVNEFIDNKYKNNKEKSKEFGEDVKKVKDSFLNMFK